jgi:hypothetical protein
LHYKPTGENEWAMAITEYASTGHILVDALQGSKRPEDGGGEPSAQGLASVKAEPWRARVPAIGYIPQPNYLLTGPADGCI